MNPRKLVFGLFGTIALLCLGTLLFNVVFRPSDTVIRENIERCVRTKLPMVNPFADSDESTIRDYTITNSYSQNGALFYDFEAKVRVIAHNPFGGKETRDVNMSGTLALEKQGNRWAGTLIR